MEGVSVTFYTYEAKKHHHQLLYEWLLEFAKKQNIQGGSVFRALAGYGRHGTLHEEHFFELAANVPIKIEFIMNEKDLTPFLDLLKKEKINLFYTTSPIDYYCLN